MKIYGIKCQKCGDTIFSRAIHDSRECSCGACAIDGGFDYQGICGEPNDFEPVILDLEVTKTELYNDWNHQRNKYGLIPEEND